MKTTKNIEETVHLQLQTFRIFTVALPFFLWGAIFHFKPRPWVWLWRVRLPEEMERNIDL